MTTRMDIRFPGFGIVVSAGSLLGWLVSVIGMINHVLQLFILVVLFYTVRYYHRKTKQIKSLDNPLEDGS